MSDAPKEEAQAPAAKPKSKMMLIIIVAVVVLAAGGGGAFFFLGKKAPDKAGAEGEKGEHAAAEHKEPAEYVRMDPPFVVNFEAKGLMRFLQITVEVMSRDKPTADMLKEHNPQIRNDLLLLFGNQKYETISTIEGKEKLRADALAIVAKVITDEGGKGDKVEQLYFTSFVMQ